MEKKPPCGFCPLTENVWVKMQGFSIITIINIIIVIIIIIIVLPWTWSHFPTSENWHAFNICWCRAYFPLEKALGDDLISATQALLPRVSYQSLAWSCHDNRHGDAVSGNDVTNPVWRLGPVPCGSDKFC